jgi:hypothetical protein
MKFIIIDVKEFYCLGEIHLDFIFHFSFHKKKLDQA